MAVLEFIEGWYMPYRRHSGRNYLSLIQHEESMQLKRRNPDPQLSSKPRQLHGDGLGLGENLYCL